MKTNLRLPLIFTIICVTFLSLATSAAQGATDPGKTVIGSIRGTVLYATNAPQKDAKVTPLSAQFKQAVKAKNIPYELYYSLGSDQGDLYKGYMNWLKPMKGSEKLMLSYQPCRSQKRAGEQLIEVSFWQNKQKVFSTKCLSISPASPIVITGPKWRDGRVIIILELDNY